MTRGFDHSVRRTGAEERDAEKAGAEEAGAEEIGAEKASDAAAPRAVPLRLYEAMGRWPGAWLARRLLARRAAQGKEDPERLGERFGRPGAPRPPGPLVWMHAASVGESLSLLPLIDRLRRERPDLALLATSGTVTSAALLAERLPSGVTHQFAPIDTPAAVSGFLDHWRPSLLAVVESEIWPATLCEARRRGVRLALVSARMSEKSARGWARAPRTIAALLQAFDSVLAQNAQVAERLIELGADPRRVAAPGALKDAAEPLPVDAAALSAERARLAGRPVWLAASTHPGEEAAAAEAHAALTAQTAPSGGRPLTLIAPRHVKRGGAIAAELAARGLRTARRSQGERPDAETDVFLVDVMGELGLWGRLAPITFVGGSLARKDGHNPMEPARLGSAVLMGPGRASCADAFDRLEAAGGARGVAAATVEAGGAALGAALMALTDAQGRPTAEAQAMGAAAAEAAASAGAVIDRIYAALEPLLPSAATGDSAPAARATAPEPAEAPAPPMAEAPRARA